MEDLFDVFRQAQGDTTSRNAEIARRDVAHTDARLRNEVLRLDEKIDRLALICQALVEILRDQGGVKESSIEAKIKEIDLRDGRQDDKVGGRPVKCPGCKRPAHTSQRVCMYCSASLQGMLVEKKTPAGRRPGRRKN